MNIRAAVVEYLNTTPLIHGLDEIEGLTLCPVVPARIADMLAAGEADIGLCSLVDAVNGTEPLAVLPAGMIGCEGPTLTVRVYSAVEPAKITRLHVDAHSHTSVVLAQVVLAEMYGARPEIRAIDIAEHLGVDGGAGDNADAWPESVLLIGDKVVRQSPPAVRYPHQLDLGEAWHGMTGGPFVYAAWMCRAADLENPEKQRDLAAVAAVLDRQRRRNRMRIDLVASRAAASHGWPADLARRYLGELLRYELGDRERAAAEDFLQRAERLGLLADGANDVIRWVEPALSPAP